jgi:hypothetical protein
MTLFDQLGNSYDYFDSNYSGPAPLYLLSYERLQPIVTQHDRMGCLLIPKTITPSVALQGQAYYPLVIETSRPEGWMSLGESKTLSVTVRISRNFTNFKTDFAVPFTITDQIRTRFRLDTTTFNFSPPNDGPEIHIIDALQMAEQSWIISPKEGTLGKQRLSKSCRGSKTVFTASERPERVLRICRLYSAGNAFRTWLCDALKLGQRTFVSHGNS